MLFQPSWLRELSLMPMLSPVQEQAMLLRSFQRCYVHRHTRWKIHDFREFFLWKSLYYISLIRKTTKLWTRWIFLLVSPKPCYTYTCRNRTISSGKEDSGFLCSIYIVHLIPKIGKLLLDSLYLFVGSTKLVRLRISGSCEAFWV